MCLCFAYCLGGYLGHQIPTGTVQHMHTLQIRLHVSLQSSSQLDLQTGLLLSQHDLYLKGWRWHTTQTHDSNYTEFISFSLASWREMHGNKFVLPRSTNLHCRVLEACMVWLYTWINGKHVMPIRLMIKSMRTIRLTWSTRDGCASFIWQSKQKRLMQESCSLHPSQAHASSTNPGILLLTWQRHMVTFPFRSLREGWVRWYTYYL